MGSVKRACAVEQKRQQRDRIRDVHTTIVVRIRRIETRRGARPGDEQVRAGFAEPLARHAKSGVPGLRRG